MSIGEQRLDQSERRRAAVLIRTAGELRAFLEAAKSSGDLRRQSIVVASGVLSDEEAVRWQNRVTRLQEACGCELGALGVVTSFIGFAVYFSAREAGWVFAFSDVCALLSITIAALVCSKLLGRWLVRRQLRSVLRCLERELACRSSRDMPSAQASSSSAAIS
jgi:multisubunit Na+/H+ antiporter MnhG subunit